LSLGIKDNRQKSRYKVAIYYLSENQLF